MKLFDHIQQLIEVHMNLKCICSVFSKISVLSIIYAKSWFCLVKTAFMKKCKYFKTMCNKQTL